MTDAKIEKVMTSNLLYTLFFTDGSSLEIYKSQFRGVSRPKAGDMFGIRQFLSWRHGTSVFPIRNPAGRTDGRKH